MGKSVYQDKHLTRPSSPSPATLSTLFLLLGTQMAPVASICVWGREPSGMHWAHHAYRGWFLRGLEPSSATRGQQPHPQPPLLDHLVSLDFSCCPTPPQPPPCLCYPGGFRPESPARSNVMLELTHQFFYLSISYLLALPRGSMNSFPFFLKALSFVGMS